MAINANLNRLYYTTFWSRIKAGLVDVVAFLPLGVLSVWSMGESAEIAALVNALFLLLYYFGYVVVSHARWGQTFGKHLAGIRVLSVSGQRIGWFQAWKRSAVDIVLGSLSVIAYIAVVSRIPSAEYPTLGWAGVQERYDALRPWWAAVAEYAYLASVPIDILWMLFNPRRRALHDYVAGTVVVYVRERVPRASEVPLTRNRSLTWSNGVVSLATALAALFCVLAAAVVSVGPTPDITGRDGLLVIAIGLTVIAVAFGMAARAMHAGSRRRWLAQGAALCITLLTILPFVL